MIHLKIYRLACFLLLCFLNTSVFGQEEIKDIEGKAKVQVQYLLVTEELNGMQIGGPRVPDNLIDLNLHKNPELRIRIKVLELHRGYRIYICNSCYKDDIYGFSRKNRLKRHLTSVNDNISIQYQYEPDNTSFSSDLPLTLFLQEGNKQYGDKDGVVFRGQSYILKGLNGGNESPNNTLSNPGTSNLEVNLEKVISILESLEGTTDKNVKVEICQKKVYLLTQSERETETGKKMLSQCRTLNIGGDKDWPNFLSTLEALDQNRERLNAIKEYLQKYPDHYQAKEKLKEYQAVEDNFAAQINTTKPIGSSTNSQSKSIAENFSLNEIGQREEIGQFVKVMLEARNHAGRQVTLRTANDVSVNELSNARFHLSIPKNIVTTITAQVEGVEFGANSNNRLRINTKIKPVKAQFELTDVQAGNYKLMISNGQPPYQLHIIDEKVGAVVHIIDVKDGYIFEASSHNNLSNGVYRLQVVDQLGAYRDAAAKKDVNLGSTFSAIGRYILLGLLLVGVGFLTYVLYKRNQKKKQLTDEQRHAYKNYERPVNNTATQTGEGDINLGNRTTTNTNTPLITEGNDTANNSSSVRKSITIKKKIKETVGQVNNEIVATTIPRLRSMSEANIPPNFLIGSQREYCNIAMNDIWDSSVVSNIYLRDIVIKRIHHFVFEENKGLMAARGEAVPEIGGWILGRFKELSPNNYIVSFERFIQMHRTAGQSTTQLKFGPESWHDVEKAKDLYREEQLEVVGWFHTHPGWGVFLSGEDINAHNTIFKQPFQIAMELESVKEPREVGFFSRRQEGDGMELNNRATAYHSWDELHQWMKSPAK